MFRFVAHASKALETVAPPTTLIRPKLKGMRWMLFKDDSKLDLQHHRQ
jgi:hypothetical protein